MNRIVVGIILLLVIIGGVVALDQIGIDSFIRKPGPDPITVKFLVGGEKSAFIKNPTVIEILKDRYGITMDGRKDGSIDMVTNKLADDIDALWPSNEIALEIYKRHFGDPAGDDLIFNSPIVFYTWKPIADGLEKKGIVKNTGTHYTVDTAALITLIQSQTNWKDIGVDALWGNATLQSTDPTKSNSGNMFSGLLANMLSGGKVATVADVEKNARAIQGFFKQMGYMEGSSGDIFRKYLDTGIGAKPIIVGYENQLVEFYIANERYRDLIEKEVVTLYPLPTFWASHPVIALNEKGKRLAKALEDEEIQSLAWSEHGFRSGLKDRVTDTGAVAVKGLAPAVTSVMPMPNASVMEKIIELLNPETLSRATATGT
ncbi:hypothetical protein [uncultured Cohaesibacter sp.]|uniref:hypothetical protein n=1 Tax=uncultured Cohaesibacter sp. TaxID=1002546 RepID=UPI0029308B31|nr:hypothetical protein [uncultured Cohaesibacter sp.]